MTAGVLLSVPGPPRCRDQGHPVRVSLVSHARPSLPFLHPAPAWSQGPIVPTSRTPLSLSVPGKQRKPQARRGEAVGPGPQVHLGVPGPGTAMGAWGCRPSSSSSTSASLGTPVRDPGHQGRARDSGARAPSSRVHCRRARSPRHWGSELRDPSPAPLPGCRLPITAHRGRREGGRREEGPWPVAGESGVTGKNYWKGGDSGGVPHVPWLRFRNNFANSCKQGF